MSKKHEKGFCVPLRQKKRFKWMAAAILLCLLAGVQSAWAQTVKLRLRNTNLAKVIVQLQQQAPQYKLSYQQEVMEKVKLDEVAVDAGSFTQALQQLQEKYGLHYLIAGNTVSFKYIPLAKPAKDAGTGVIEGAVIDEESRQPVTGATVQVGKMAAITGTDGSFSIKMAEGSYEMGITYVGYEKKLRKDVVVSKGETTKTEFAIRQDKSQLGDVVVTALGITKEKKRLGYAVQEVKGDDINVAQGTNMLTALQGKVAGMNMTMASTGIANSVRVVLRGESSLNINKNQALVVVDGMPINNNAGTAASNDLPVDYGSGGAEINPDDIESISILKGPNAAALYGSRAASGVLVIKTKKGASKRLGISVNSSAVFDRVLKLPDFQNEYGGGTGVGLKYYSYGDGPDGPNTSNSGHNWGAPFQGQNFIQYGSPLDENGNRTKSPWVAHPDNVKDFYETGKAFNNSISVYKSGDIGNFRASYNNFNQTGIMPNTELHRHQFNVNTGINITSKVSFNANVNYINSYSDNLPVVGYGSGSPTYNFLWFERNADINWFKNYWVKGKEGIKQDYYFTWGDNPYMTMYEQLNGLKRNRVFGNAYVNYDIVKGLKLMVRTGIDYSGDIRISRRPIGSVVALTGLYRRQDYTYFERNSDFLLSYDGNSKGDFKWSASLGGNSLQINTYNNTTTANGLVIPNVYNLGNASSRPSIAETNTLKNVNSLYAVGDLGYKNLLFLQLTARNDWSSTLPAGNNSYFYPSASLSAVVSDIFKLKPTWLDFWKLRTSYASVGNDTDPYQIDPYYDYSTLPGSVTLPGTLPNATLKPEIITSFEVGTEFKLFRNRVGVDFTYYSSESKNQILRSPLAVSSGYSAKVMNAGKITNKGFELAVQFTPVRGAFNWDISFTGSANRSKVVELADGVNSYVMATAQNATIEARVGGRMGDIYGIGFLRNAEGKIIYKDGVPVFDSKTMKIGNYNPDFIAGIRNSLRYKGISLSVLFDGRFGGTIYSYSHSAGSEAGSLTNTLPGRVEGIVGDGVVQDADGKFSPNTTNVAAYTFYRGYYKRPNVESNSFDATFCKLREVIVGYSLPAKIIAHTPFQSLQLNLTGRNLLLFSDAPGFDPETAFVTGGTIVPGIENAQIPSTRSFGLDLKVTF
jgi:TonB-linked SusC/RagA family outer membrane protein